MTGLESAIIGPAPRWLQLQEDAHEDVDRLGPWLPPASARGRAVCGVAAYTSRADFAIPARVVLERVDGLAVVYFAQPLRGHTLALRMGSHVRNVRYCAGVLRSCNGRLMLRPLPGAHGPRLADAVAPLLDRWFL